MFILIMTQVSCVWIQLGIKLSLASSFSSERPSPGPREIETERQTIFVLLVEMVSCVSLSRLPQAYSGTIWVDLGEDMLAIKPLLLMFTVSRSQDLHQPVSREQDKPCTWKSLFQRQWEGVRSSALTFEISTDFCAISFNSNPISEIRQRLVSRWVKGFFQSVVVERSWSLEEGKAPEISVWAGGTRLTYRQAAFWSSDRAEIFRVGIIGCLLRVITYIMNCHLIGVYGTFQDFPSCHPCGHMVGGMAAWENERRVKTLPGLNSRMRTLVIIPKIMPVFHPSIHLSNHPSIHPYIQQMGATLGAVQMQWGIGHTQNQGSSPARGWGEAGVEVLYS